MAGFFYRSGDTPEATLIEFAQFFKGTTAASITAVCMAQIGINRAISASPSWLKVDLNVVNFDIKCGTEKSY